MQLEFLGVDERLARFQMVESRVQQDSYAEFDKRFVASWIYHDLSLDGRVFRNNELERALAGLDEGTWLERQLLHKVRAMERTIGFVRREAAKHRPFDLELVKEMHRFLCPDGDESAGRYRKDTGESGPYRHLVVPPKSISYRLRRLISGLNDATVELEHPIKTACEIHQGLCEIFPFATDNGIVARMAMNFWILRAGYPPAVIHVHDRYRYFDSYLGENGDFRTLIVQSVMQAMGAYIRVLPPAVSRFQPAEQALESN